METRPHSSLSAKKIVIPSRFERRQMAVYSTLNQHSIPSGSFWYVYIIRSRPLLCDCNFAPAAWVGVVRLNEDGERELVRMRWRLIALSWKKPL
jgi:hypothetical protein